MSDEAPDQDSKTEDPSQKKLEDAHKKGDVAKSQEVTTWFMLVGSGVVFAFVSPWISGQLSQSLSLIFMNADQFDLEGAGFADFFNALALSIIGVVLIPLAVLMVCGILANLVQHRLVWSLDPIKPKLSKISPIGGFKRLFSTDALVNFGKGLVKVGVVGAIVVGAARAASVTVPKSSYWGGKAGAGSGSAMARVWLPCERTAIRRTAYDDRRTRLAQRAARGGSVTHHAAATIIAPPIQPPGPTRSPKPQTAISAPNTGSLPISSDTRLGLVREAAWFCAKKANTVHSSTR